MSVLEIIDNYKDLHSYYYDNGFTFRRTMTSEERKKHNAKAHVFQEYVPHIEFKYVPLNGKHVFMFKRIEDRAYLDRYCGCM